MMNFAYRLKVQSCQLRSYTEFFATGFAYNRPYSNNNLPYGNVCVLQHPKVACYYFAVFFSSTLSFQRNVSFTSVTETRLLFLAAQKLLPVIDYIQTTHNHINQRPRRQCIYTAIQEGGNAPNRTYVTRTIYF